MEEIINILMLRDNLSYNEACIVFDDCVEALNHAILNGDSLEAEDIIRDYLGLEPDYFEIIVNEMY